MTGKEGRLHLYKDILHVILCYLHVIYVIQHVALNLSRKQHLTASF